MPLNSSPDSILNKTNKKINKIVNKTFIDGGREDEIRKMYADKRAFIAEQFIKAKPKVVDIKSNNSDRIVE
jgi:L-lactate utilization protein LutB